MWHSHTRKWFINETKANGKVECTIGNNGEMLHGLCVTVTQEEQNSSTEKMNET